MDFIVHSFFVILSIGWGFNIFFCILLGVRLQRKADELWLLYCPPPALGTAVTIQNLVQDVTLTNGESGQIKVPFSPITRRTGIQLSVSSKIVFVIKWQHIQFTPESYHWLKQIWCVLLQVFKRILQTVFFKLWNYRTLVRFVVAYSVLFL